MKTKVIFSIALATLLSSCSRQNSSICQTPVPDTVSNDDHACILRQSYALARSTGTNTEISKAVVQECYGQIDTRILEALPKVPEENRDNYYADGLKDAEKEALMRVVEARAGHCDALS